MLNEIKTLIEMDWAVVFIAIAAILGIFMFCTKAGREITSTLGIKTKWSIKRDEQDNRLDNLQKGFEEMERQRQKDVSKSIERDDGFEASINKISEVVANIDSRLQSMEEAEKANRLSELKDRISQAFRFYKRRYERTGKKEWSCVEEDAFWSLFERYVDMGGNHFVKDVIEPFMREFEIVDMDKIKE